MKRAIEATKMFNPLSPFPPNKHATGYMFCQSVPTIYKYTAGHYPERHCVLHSHPQPELALPAPHPTMHKLFIVSHWLHSIWLIINSPTKEE